MTLRGLARNDLTEQEYHDHPAISHTDIYKYHQEGFGYIAKRRNHIESPSLTFGSMVDKLVTEPERFQDEFLVLDIKIPTGKPKDIAEDLYASFGNECDDFRKLPLDGIVDAMNKAEYYLNRTAESRFKSLEESAKTYYNFLCAKGSRTIVNKEDYNEALECSRMIKFSPVTAPIFNNNLPDGYERLFQLKFIVTHDLVEYKFMPDVVIVNHNDKVIMLYDLKTTSRNIYDFPKQYLTYGYDAQQYMYKTLMEDVIRGTEFDEYKVSWCGFAVVSRAESTHTPVVFTCNAEMDYDAFALGQQMYESIASNSQYPSWMKSEYYNDITKIVESLKSNPDNPIF